LNRHLAKPKKRRWNATSGRVGKTCGVAGYLRLQRFNAIVVGDADPPLRKRKRENKVRESLNGFPKLSRARHLALLYRFAKWQSRNRRGSRHSSAPPPEKQRDYEQYKKYKEQEFGDAHRRCGDAAKSKDRCHKRDN
jgi:hypothetical protein